MLKVLGVLLMVSDHIGLIFFGSPEDIAFRGVGRLAFPIFAYLLAKGYSRTTDYSIYLKRIIAFAIVSQYPYYYFLVSSGIGGVSLNIGFTLLFGLVCIHLFEKAQEKNINYLLIGLIMVLSDLLKVDYGMTGVAIILLFYLFKMKKDKPIILFAILFLILSYFFISRETIPMYFDMLGDIEFILYSILLSILVSGISILIVNLVSDTRLRFMKWIFYIFYPVHLFVLGWIKNNFF